MKSSRKHQNLHEIPLPFPGQYLHVHTCAGSAPYRGKAAHLFRGPPVSAGHRNGLPGNKRGEKSKPLIRECFHPLACSCPSSLSFLSVQRRIIPPSTPPSKIPTLLRQNTHKPKLTALQLLWGLTANCILLMYYSAPLSVMSTVIKTKSSALINPTLAACNTLNGCFWWVAYYICIYPCGLHVLYIRVHVCIYASGFIYT